MAAVSDLLLLNTRMVVISLCFVPSSNSPQSLGFLLLNLKRQTANTGTPSVPLRHTHTHTHAHTHTHTHTQMDASEQNDVLGEHYDCKNDGQQRGVA
jgi:hypothetical protein